MLLQAVDLTELYREASELIPQGKYDTHLLKIVALGVSIEHVLIGTLTWGAWLVKIIYARSIWLLFVFARFQFVLVTGLLLLVGLAVVNGLL